MTNWAPAAISSLALLFAVLSFWWMNWRPGSLKVGSIEHLTIGKTSHRAEAQPSNLVITIPLILFNGGARPVIVESLRLTPTAGCQLGTTVCVATRSGLVLSPTSGPVSRDTYFFPKPLKANEILKTNFVFERQDDRFKYGALLYHMHLEARLFGSSGWRKLRDIEIDLRQQDGIAILGLEITEHVFPYHPRKDA